MYMSSAKLFSKSSLVLAKLVSVGSYGRFLFEAKNILEVGMAMLSLRVALLVMSLGLGLGSLLPANENCSKSEFMLPPSF
jgi:hypothetical protein